MDGAKYVHEKEDGAARRRGYLVGRLSSYNPVEWDSPGFVSFNPNYLVDNSR